MRRALFAAFVTALAVLASGELQAAEDRAPPIAVTAAGALSGAWRGPTDAVFKGIPYALPPVGDRRWRPPETQPGWTGVRPAVAAGAPCKQRSFGWNAAEAQVSSEDCLYLDVRTPDFHPGARLPVMVMIHGGANHAGSGSGFIESNLVGQGVVLVTLNYRLGAFGFLSHPELTREGKGASGNYALLDQIEALKWVRANIAAFGGDPDNVTIFGHSAGAEDVGLLRLIPAAKGLFVRAIEESGSPGFGLPPRSLRQNEALGLSLQHLLKAQTLAQMRSASADDVLASADQLLPPIEDKGFIWLQAVVDGRVLPAEPQTLLVMQPPKTPVIIGFSARELGLYGGSANIAHALALNFGSQADLARQFYQPSAENTAADPVLGDVAMQLSTDVMFRCPAEYVAARAAKAYVYQLDVAKPGSGAPVTHGSELGFVFDRRPDGAADAEWPPLQAYWTNFAKTGNPNGVGLALWPAYRSELAVLEFSLRGPIVELGFRQHICRLAQRP